MSRYASVAVQGRLEPLRVQPFGRLLASYTVNDLGDSIGVVALAVLVFDRTHDVAPTAGFFLVAKFLPALFATALTAQLDRKPVRRGPPGLYGGGGPGVAPPPLPGRGGRLL